ncbi:MAG: hypothetical protein O9972_39805 [Burkholderiales bacterium]|nr:hypothetical protein [Burkholderiales bacterium]
MSDPVREEELRIHALGAAISRRDWSEIERAHAAIRDHFHAKLRDKTKGLSGRIREAIAIAGVSSVDERIHIEVGLDPLGAGIVICGSTRRGLPWVDLNKVVPWAAIEDGNINPLKYTMTEVAAGVAKALEEKS